MKHAKLVEATLTAKECTSEQAIHEYLKEQLSFPDYYGKNLSALADCLSEMGNPVLLTLKIDDEELEPGMQAYVLRLAQVCAREALANENVALIIEH